MSRPSLSLSLLLLGCSSTPDGYFLQPAPLPSNVLTADIDTDGGLPLPAGDGGVTPDLQSGKRVQLLVEYAAGGQWHVVATCDTDASAYACSWDLVASVKAGKPLKIGDAKTELEKGDQVLRVDGSAVRLIFWTDANPDGVTLSAPPGESLELDAVLDGNHFDPTDPRWPHPSWVSGGVAAFAESNPVVLAPTTP